MPTISESKAVTEHIEKGETQQKFPPQMFLREILVGTFKAEASGIDHTAACPPS
jgi:hypothetical protein